RDVGITQSDLVAGIDDGVGTNGCRVRQIGRRNISKSSNTGVVVAGGVAAEREEPAGGVRAAGGVAGERIEPAGGVVAAGGVDEERIEPAGGVEATGGVQGERTGPAGRVAEAGVQGERTVPDSGGIGADDDARQREI